MTPLTLNHRHRPAKGRQRAQDQDCWDVLTPAGLYAKTRTANLTIMTRVLEWADPVEKWRRWLDRLGALDRSRAVAWILSMQKEVA